MKKEFIQANCQKTQCPHWNDPCCQVCTEIVKVTDGPVHLMFIGMGAGKDEDINLNRRNSHRQPWVGRAGKYLRSMIKWLWDNNNKFNIALSNTVRCHPMNEKGKDRQPTKVEEENCLELLQKDIESVRPRILVPCGISSSVCISPKLEGSSMGSIHGNVVKSIFNIPALPTYHSSFLTRQYGSFDQKKHNIFDQKVMADLRQAISITKGE